MYPEIASMFSDIPSIVWEEIGREWGGTVRPGGGDYYHWAFWVRLMTFCQPGSPDYFVRQFMAILGPVETTTLTRDCNFYRHQESSGSVNPKNSQKKL